MKPLRNNVLIKPQEKANESIAGIIIASAVSNQGLVVAVGPECKELKPGDCIRYDEKSCAKIDSLLMCREQDVYCIVE